MTEQEKIFKNSPSKFRVGNKVKHKVAPQFDMIIIELLRKDFDSLILMSMDGIGNPEWLLCRYYNMHTNLWEEKEFNYVELELVDPKTSTENTTI